VAAASESELTELNYQRRTYTGVASRLRRAAATAFSARLDSLGSVFAIPEVDAAGTLAYVFVERE
jgi:hypothetical protein